MQRNPLDNTCLRDAIHVLEARLSILQNTDFVPSWMPN